MKNARFADKVMRFTQGAMAAGLGVMAVVVFINVVLRYGFGSGIPASEELSRLLFVWMVFIGAAAAYPAGEHMAFTSLAGLLARIVDGSLSSKMGKQVFEAMWLGDESADAIIERLGLKQVSDSGALAGVIDEIIAANPKQVEQYRGGNDKLLQFFVGQAMKATKGQANPAQLNELLRERLKVQL